MWLNLIVIRTDKPKELSEFYTLLGMSFEYHHHGKGPWHYSAPFTETVFEIYPLMKKQEFPDESLRLGLTIHHLDELTTKPRKENVDLIQEPTHSEWRYYAIIKDLEGQKIG